MRTICSLALAFVLAGLAPSAAAAEAELDPEQLGEAMFWNGPGAIRCADALCHDASKAQQDPKCADKKCANVREKYSLKVTEVRYDGKTLRVAGKLGYTFVRGGADPAFGPRTTPVWLGLTVRQGEEETIDVPAKEIKAAGLNGPFTIEAEVGPDVRSWVVALWHKKFSPCKVSRPGCEEYGYVLGGPLAWEPECAYRCTATERCGFANCMGFNPMLQGQGAVRVQVRDAGGGKAWAKQAVAAARKVLGAEATLYGRKLQVKVGKPAKNKRPCLEVLYKHDGDHTRAAVLAEQVLQAGGYVEETEWGDEYAKHKVTHWPKAPADYVIAVGERCMLGG